MPDFMGDNEGARSRLTDVPREYCAALIVKDRTRPLQSGIARWQPGDIQLELDDRRMDELHGLRRAAFTEQRGMKSGCGFADWFERVHGIIL
jgi:hypothetical protein